MAVLHVEDNADTRGSLARNVGVVKNFVEGHEWIATQDTVRAAARLGQGTVHVLVLDLQLDNAWSNRNLRRVLLQLVGEQPRLVSQDEEKFDAYRLAVLAHKQGVPCALLTNHADYLDPARGLTLDSLRDAFNAEEVFNKDENGSIQCAAWVKKQLGLR